MKQRIVRVVAKRKLRIRMVDDWMVCPPFPHSHVQDRSLCTWDVEEWFAQQ